VYTGVPAPSSSNPLKGKKGSIQSFEKIEIWILQLQQPISLPQYQRYMFSEKD
jgi:hypothetical protein